MDCQIFSAINNDCLLYIANSTHMQSEQCKLLNRDRLAGDCEGSSSDLKFTSPQDSQGKQREQQIL